MLSGWFARASACFCLRSASVCGERGGDGVSIIPWRAFPPGRWNERADRRRRWRGARGAGTRDGARGNSRTYRPAPHAPVHRLESILRGSRAGEGVNRRRTHLHGGLRLALHQALEVLVVGEIRGERARGLGSLRGAGHHAAADAASAPGVDDDRRPAKGDARGAGRDLGPASEHAD